MKSNDNVTLLRQLYGENETIKAVLDCFAKRERNSTITKVDRLFSILERSGVTVSRGNLVKALRKLAQLGYGRFLVGRRGHPSRVTWSVGIASLGQAAAGIVGVVEPLPSGMADLDETESEGPGVVPARSANAAMMKVKYPLRVDLEVEMCLPKDLTRRESERLSEFIKSLPFGETGLAA